MFGENLPIREIIRFDIQRKVSAHKTMESWTEKPHAGIIIDLDVTNILAYREKLKKSEKFSDVRPSLNSITLKIIAESVKAFPELNAYVEYNQKGNYGTLTVFEDINIAIPYLLPDGRTITPVIKQVGKKSVKEVCEEVADLQRRVKNTDIDILLFQAGYQDTIDNLKKGKIKFKRIRKNFFGKHKVNRPSRDELAAYKQIADDDKVVVDDLVSATMLVSNVGSIYRNVPCAVGLLEIIPPQVTVVGLGSVQKKPAAIKDESGEYKVAVRDIMPTSFYCDHRGMDFGPAVGAFEKLVDICKKPHDYLE